MQITSLPLKAKIELLRRGYNAVVCAKYNISPASTQEQVVEAWIKSRPASEDPHPECPDRVFDTPEEFTAIVLLTPVVDAQISTQQEKLVALLISVILSDQSKAGAVFQAAGIDPTLFF